MAEYDTHDMNEPLITIMTSCLCRDLIARGLVIFGGIGAGTFDGNVDACALVDHHGILGIDNPFL